MAQANGAGQQISGGGHGIPAPYTRVYCQVQPVLVDPTTGAPIANPGTFDTEGKYLHFRYEGNLNLGARSGGNQTPGALDFVPNKIIVEFDAQSSFTLPFEGQLYLVGGRGEWKFGVQVLDQIPARDYRPELRTLSAYCRAGSTYVIPDFHTYIMSADPAAPIILPTGNVLVPGNLEPGQHITSGIPINVGPRDNTIKTGWRG